MSVCFSPLFDIFVKWIYKKYTWESSFIRSFIRSHSHMKKKLQFVSNGLYKLTMKTVVWIVVLYENLVLSFSSMQNIYIKRMNFQRVFIAMWEKRKKKYKKKNQSLIQRANDVSVSCKYMPQNKLNWLISRWGKSIEWFCFFDDIYLRCLGLDVFAFGLCLADTLPFGEPGDFFDFGDCSKDKEKLRQTIIRWISLSWQTISNLV